MQEFIEKDRKYVAQTYSRLPVVFKEGRGVILRDIEDKEYIDCIAGIAVLNLGHSHPRIVEAIADQASRLMHTSNLYYIENQISLAERLYKLSGGYSSFFCNSGAEAVESALKLTRKYSGRKEIIAMKNSFHGRTLGALSATGQEKYKRDFEPLLQWFKHIEYGSLTALEKAVSGDTGAVILEPIQGEGGIIVPPSDYLRGVREICEDKDVLLIFDEVQTGMGRVGEFFAWQHFEVKPDIFTLAKALGSGLPIGAMLAKAEVMEAFKSGDHASTFGGNPFATRVAGETVDVLLDEKLIGASRRLGKYFMNRLEEIKEKHRLVKEVRGRGMMIGLELNRSCSGIVNQGLKLGLLLNCIHDTTLRFTPPLVITEVQIDEVIDKLDTILGEIEHEA